MKKLLALVFVISFPILLLSQNNKVLFFDDFEETIGDNTTFINWTTENLEGWQYWHIILSGGNPGNCMRFENNDLPQNDWLITKQIIGEDIQNVLLNFDVLHHGQGIKPSLFFTNKYNGNASQSTWTEIEYSLGTNEDTWYNSDKIILENPGDTLYFAFYSKVDANAGMLFLLDNFKVKSYIPPAPFVNVGAAEHFEFYTNLSGEEDFYLTIQDSLENQYDKLSSLWNRPGIEDVFKESDKIEVYYSAKNDIYLADDEIPGWKCGFHDNSSKKIYLAPLENQQQTNFYRNFPNLAVNEFSQLAISLKLLRENNTYFPSYFLEGFGLYESGFRPDRDDVIQYVNDELEYSYITDTSDIGNNSLKKSLIIANIEGQVLTPWSYLGLNAGASSFVASQWQNYLKHFYTKPESDRIKLQHSSEHFDFYGADSDNSHMTEAYSYFENACSYYIENYNFEPGHRFNVVFSQTEQIGIDLTTYSRFNGGAGCGGDLVMELSPNYNYKEENFYSDYFGYAGLCAHEFFHIFYNHFMWEIPGGFWAEGTADFSQRHSLNWPIPQHSVWNINALFTDYKDKYNVDINLKHISNNPNGELDIYFFGDMFFEFLYQNYDGFENIKKFFNQGMDYSVFGTTYEEIDSGYINFLKSLAGITDVEEMEEIPLEMFIEKNQLAILNTKQIQNAEIEIFTISGQKLFKKNAIIYPNEKYSLSLPNSVKSKFFIVRVQTENYTGVKKIYNPGY